MTPLTVVCWRWAPLQGYRSTFSPATVRVLRNMVARHYAAPHRFVCVTDKPAEIDRDIETIPLWNDFAAVPSPHGGKNPSCYRRLRLFHPEAAAVFGERFVSLDLDTVILDDVRPLWDRAEDFVAWGDTNPKPGSHYNGSMLLIRAGSRSQVWKRFDPKVSPTKALQAGCYGSDQGWISYCLGPGEKRWTKADGVYSFRNDIKTRPKQDVPANARMVMFHGSFDPWTPYIQMRFPWIKEHWQ